MTVEADEAWMLLSVGQLAGGPFASRTVIDVPVLTSGGLYAATHYLLLLAAQPIEAHRLISFLFAALTLAAAYAIVRAQGAPPSVGAFAVVAFMTVPGLMLQAGMATAEMTATFLVIVGAWFWTARGADSLAGSVSAGLVFGLACATRTSALIVLLAIVAWGALGARANPRALVRAIVAAAVASVAFALCNAVYYLLFRAPSGAGLAGAAEFLGHTTGLVATRNKTSMMAYFLVSENLLPFFAIAAAATALALDLPAGLPAKTRSLCVLLILIGGIGWIGWIWRAPFPHVRYLYPALPAIWLAGTLLVARWLTELGPGRPRLLLEAAVISAFAAQFAISVRQVCYGESLAVVYEAVGVSPIKTNLAVLGARRDQNQLASVLARLPEQAQVCSLSKEFSYPITLLNGKVIESLYDRVSNRQNRTCRYLVFFPADKTLWIPTEPTAEWIRHNTRLTTRFGDYSVYEIDAGAPDLTPPLVAPLGEQPPP